MKRDSNAPQLSAVFVDYDNIYLSLKRRNEDAAKRFSKDAAVWLKAIEQGRLITSNGAAGAELPRRIVLNRCYGNPVPRRNQADNSTDMSSFPFVRHHFLRAGFEIVDCPPLTSHQKNAADIRMVMDLRDCLTHATYFDEFIILSGDADFTPVLHRLRQHARRTVIYSNDHTAAAYGAICDGEVREADLIAALLDQHVPQIETQTLQAPVAPQAAPQAPVQQPIVLHSQPAPQQAPSRLAAAQLRLDDLRNMIMAEVAGVMRLATGPVPLEALADRAIRSLGHERTVATAWAGAGSFSDLMRAALPAGLRLTEQAPFHVYDPQRHLIAAPAPVQELTPQAQTVAQQREALAAAMADLTQADVEEPEPMPVRAAPVAVEPPRPSRYMQVRASAGPAPRPAPQPVAEAPAPAPAAAPAAVAAAPVPLAARAGEAVMHRATATRSTAQATPGAARTDTSPSTQASLARIQAACQAPTLAPSDYRILFAAMAQEISENGLTGAQTLTAIAERAQGQGLALRREDARFVLDVVSEPDPWFEQGASPTLFAGRFRNFVVARCRDHGLQLSASELDLIDSWIIGGAAQSRPLAAETRGPAAQPQAAPSREASGSSRWWAPDDRANEAGAPAAADEDFPRIVRARQR